MNSSVVVISLLVLVVLAIIIYGNKKTQSEPDKASHSSSAGAGREEELDPESEAQYQLGLHPGEDGQALMYTLSSCRHCVNVREWLEEEKIPFHEVYVDHYFGEKRVALMEKLRSYNARGSFPTLVLPGGKGCVVGFRVMQLRKEFGRE